MDLPFIFKEPATEGTDTVDIIRIPEHSLPVEIVTVPLMRTAHLPTIAGQTRLYESHLTHVPNLLSNKYQDWWEYAEKHRELVDLGNMDPEQPLKHRLRQHGPYFMYKFPIDAQKVLAGRPNEHFMKAGIWQEVLGNAFIFKLKEPVGERRVVERGNSDRAIQLENLDKTSITSAFNGKGISAQESLKWLSAQ